MTLYSGGVKSIVLYSKRIQMTLISQLVSMSHLHIKQFLTGFSQTWCCSIVLDTAVLQIIQPLLNGGCSHIIELVYTNQIIFRKHLFGCLHLNHIVLLNVDLQRIACMYTLKGINAVIQIVGTLSKIKIEDIDRIDLFYIAVALSERDMLSDCLSHTIENTFKIIKVCGKLHFNNDNGAFRILGFDVHTVELVVLCLLITFAL